MPYRTKGRTNDVTVCGRCGREDLSHTVMLVLLDDEGNDTDDIAYLGSECATRTAGWTPRELNRNIKAAEQATRETQRAQFAWDTAQKIAARNAWCEQKYGCPITEVRDETGKRRSVWSLDHEWETTVA